MDVDEELKKRLDAVVGDRYDPPRPLAARAAGWVPAAALAVVAAAVVMGVLHKYMTQAETAPAPRKPVPVTILPPR